MKIKVNKRVSFISLFFLLLSCLSFMTACYPDFWDSYYANRSSVGIASNLDRIVSHIGYQPLAITAGLFFLALSVLIVWIHNYNLRKNKPEV